MGQVEHCVMRVSGPRQAAPHVACPRTRVHRWLRSAWAAGHMAAAQGTHRPPQRLTSARLLAWRHAASPAPRPAAALVRGLSHFNELKCKSQRWSDPATGWQHVALPMQLRPNPAAKQHCWVMKGQHVDGTFCKDAAQHRIQAGVAMHRSRTAASAGSAPPARAAPAHPARSAGCATCCR
jgi:hypothetical protein